MNPHDAYQSPTYVATQQLLAVFGSELPRYRSEASWLCLIEDDLLGYLLAVSSKKPDAYRLCARTRRFTARLLDTLGLTPRTARNGRLCRRGIKQARAVALASIIECRVLSMLIEYCALPDDTLEDACLLLSYWQGNRLSGLLTSAASDTLGFDDDWELPCVCGEVDLKAYHTLFQQ